MIISGLRGDQLRRFFIYIPSRLLLSSKKQGHFISWLPLFTFFWTLVIPSKANKEEKRRKYKRRREKRKSRCYFVSEEAGWRGGGLRVGTKERGVEVRDWTDGLNGLTDMTSVRVALNGPISFLLLMRCHIVQFFFSSSAQLWNQPATPPDEQAVCRTICQPSGQTVEHGRMQSS